MYKLIFPHGSQKVEPDLKNLRSFSSQWPVSLRHIYMYNQSGSLCICMNVTRHHAYTLLKWKGCKKYGHVFKFHHLPLFKLWKLKFTEMILLLISVLFNSLYLYNWNNQIKRHYKWHSDCACLVYRSLNYDKIKLHINLPLASYSWICFQTFWIMWKRWYRCNPWNNGLHLFKKNSNKIGDINRWQDNFQN